MRSGAREIVELFMQSWPALATLAAANLGVADAVGDQPKPVDQIARDLGVDADSLHRLMRGLAAAGVFREEAGGFVHTPRSAALRTGAPGDARAVIRMFGLRSTREAAAEYEHAITTGGSAFEKVFGTANPFETLAERPDELAIYHEGMSVDHGTAAIAKSLDVGDRTALVDVGGGRGVLLSHVLAAHPQTRAVLFDLPVVVAAAPEILRGVIDRCEIRGGDLRTDVPTGDGYLLKNILHGWPDDECVALLKRIRSAARPKARVFVIENVMPEGNDPAPCKVFDLFLLLGGGRSRVRSAAEFGRVLASAGFTLDRVVPVFANQAIVEASLAE